LIVSFLGSKPSSSDEERLEPFFSHAPAWSGAAKLGLLGQRGGLIMQTRRASMAEAVVNTVVGCVIGYLIVLAVIKQSSPPSLLTG
jgi:hypothetical protein